MSLRGMQQVIPNLSKILAYALVRKRRCCVTNLLYNFNNSYVPFYLNRFMIVYVREVSIPNEMDHK